MNTRLQQLRETLQERETDLQRLYNFKFTSTKLNRFVFNIDIYVVEVNHPYFQFQNQGDYRGLINGVTKPGDISITFLEDARHSVNSVFEIWDGLKYNKETGIHYPKATYEDQAILTYLGPRKEDASKGDLFQRKSRMYLLTGLYPINREPVSLSYGSNDVETLIVSFNVDYIKPLFVPLT